MLPKRRARDVDASAVLEAGYIWLSGSKQMGFHIFLMAIDGDDAKFDRAIAERAFRHIVESTEGDCWQIVLPDGPCFGQINIKDQAEVDGLGVERPPFSPLFCDALYELMRQTPTLLFWPGEMDPDPICCVANVALLSKLPETVRKNWIAPTVVTNGADIKACIARTA